MKNELKKISKAIRFYNDNLMAIYNDIYIINKDKFIRVEGSIIKTDKYRGTYVKRR